MTGAAGFIGSHLAETLVADGHEVVGVDSFNDYYDPARKRENAERLDVLEADLLDVDLDGLLEGVDGVYHLAGQPGVRASFGPDFAHYVTRNVQASARLFEAAARRGLRVVYASSSSIYGDAESYPTREDATPQPISPYGVSKLCVEHLAYAHARTAGLTAVGVRFFTVYGPRQRPDMAFTPLLEALDAGSAFRLFGDGSASRSFTFVADAAAGMVAAMERGRAGELYNIGGGEEATMIEAIALAEQLAGRELDVERHGIATGDVRRTRADVAKAERELGWRPTTPLADGLRAQWEWVAARVVARVSEVRRRDGVDLDAEREVDLRSAWTRISDRWWLPLGGLVLGAILGVLVAVGSGDVYRAEALLYLGQPFTPAGGGQLQSLQTNPKTVSEIVRSEAAIRVAANAADMQPGALRGNVTSTAVVQPGQVARNFTPLVEVEVRGPTKVKAEKAANSFANTVTQAVVPYITQKMTPARATDRRRRGSAP